MATQWIKTTLEDRFFSVFVFLGLILSLVSFYIDSLFIFGFSLFVLLMGAGNSYYMKHIGEGLIILDKKERKRFFIGSEDGWELAFLNQGLPIMNGTLTVFFDDAVVPLSDDYQIHQSIVNVSIPFSIRRNAEALIRIPYKADRRGIARIRKVELHIPHFFGFGEISLEYKGSFGLESLVYPRRTAVRNPDHSRSLKQGYSPDRYSLFEDNLGPVGTRDYLPTDSFNRINWKASARSMTLQTKEFESISERGVVFMVNAADGYSITGELEFLMSSIADMGIYFQKADIPYSFCLNIRSVGAVPFAYLQPGSGKDHLQKLLDLLALADYHSPTIPYEKMVFFCQRHFPALPVLIHAGKRTTGAEAHLRKLEGAGTKLLQLQRLEDGSAFLAPFKVMMKEVAGND